MRDIGRDELTQLVACKSSQVLLMSDHPTSSNRYTSGIAAGPQVAWSWLLSHRHLTSTRSQVIGVLASATTVPIARAAATAGMNHPGRARARQRLQIATSNMRMPNTMLPT